MSEIKTKSEHKTMLRNIATRLTLTSIPESALLPDVVTLLKEYTAFKDAHSDIDESIYQGDIFAQVLSEKDLFVEKISLENIADVINQLEALYEVVTTDYVLISKT